MMKQKLPTTFRISQSLEFQKTATINGAVVIKSSTITQSGIHSKMMFLLAFLLSLMLGLNTLQAQITNAPPNEISPWTTNTYPSLQATLVDDVPSALPLCLGSATGEASLIDPDLTNSASITFTVGIGVAGGCNATFGVADTVNTYPAGTWAGFRVGTAGLLGTSVGLSVSIATYNGGVQVETQSFDAGLISANLLSSNVADLGFITTAEFDEIRITYTTLVAVAQTVVIYHASIMNFVAGPPLACNTTTSMMQPIYPMSISEDNTDLSSLLTINAASASNNVIDSDPTNFATLDFTLGSGSLSVKDELSSYTAGTFAGFDMESTSLLSVGLLDGVTISTYLDGTFQEDAAGSSDGILALNTSILGSGNERGQIGFITTMPFDEVQITGTGALGSMNVYGLVLKSFCVTDPNALTCNTPVMATEPDFPLLINGVNTGVSGISVGAVTNTSAVIDADPNTFATIDMAAGVLGDASLSVLNPLESYPVNTYVGFDLENIGLLDLGLLNSVTMTTYLDGSVVESVDGTSEALLAVDSGLLFGGSGRYQIGFVATAPFDEVQITLNQTLSVDLGATNIYGLVLQALCEAPITCEVTPLSNPGQPVIINSAGTGVNGVLSVGTSLENVQNVISQDETDFATVTLVAGAAETISISVLNPVGGYPAGSQAGFMIRDANDLLEVGLFDRITISTYLDGVAVESQTSSGLLLLDALGLISVDLSGGTDPSSVQFVGLTTTGAYDEVRIEVGSIATVINQFEVYGAYVNPQTVDGLDNNPTVQITSIGEDNVINLEESTSTTVPVVGAAGGDAAEGDNVTVTVNGVDYSTTVQADNTFTVNVSGSDLVADSSLTVTGLLTHVGVDVSCITTAEASLAYTIDTTAPTVPSVDVLVTNDPTPVITGTADSVDNLTVTVNGVTYTEGDGNLVDNGDNTWTLQVPDGNEIPDNVYDVVATATDAAGNPSIDTSDNELTIDSTAPTVPTVDVLVTNDQTPTLTGTADSVDELTVSVNGITYTEGDGNLVDNNDGTWTLQVPVGNEIPEEKYDVVATTTDTAGNTSIDGTLAELTIDLTAPTAPTVNEYTTSSHTPALTGTADSVDELTVAVNGVTYTEGDGNLTDNGDNTWTLQIPVGNEIPDGTYDVVATATDLAGNTSVDGTVDELVIDPNALTTPTVAVLLTNDTTPTITGTADSVNDLTVTVNGVTYTEGDGNLVDNGDDTWTLTVPAGNEILDGVYDVLATVTDGTGGTSTDTTSDELTIDIIAPNAPTVIPISTNSPTPEIMGTANSEDVLTVTVNGVTYTEGDGNLVDHGDGTWTLQIPVGNEIPDGIYDVVATATDLAGNSTSDGTLDELTIDSSVPTVPTVNTLVTNSSTPEITGTADSEDELTVGVNGVVYAEGNGSLTDNGDNTWTLQIPVGNEIPDGVYDVSATAMDAVGNVSTDSTVDELVIDMTAPTVPTVDPIATPDTTPLITGTADSEDNLTVEVNGVVYTEGDGNLVDNGDGTWSLQVPDGNEIPVGTYDVVVTVTDAGGETSTDATTDELTIDPSAPTVPTVDPIATPDPTPLITGTADSEDDLTVEVNGVVYTEGDGNLVDNGDGTWSLQVPDGNEVPVGTYDVVVTVRDANGNTSNDTTTDELTIDSLPVSDISITKVVDQLNPLVGDLINFTVTVSNNGATEFSDLIIDEVITSGFTYNRHIASLGVYNATSGQWKLDKLGANQTATLQVSAQVNPTGNHTNVASIRSSVPEDDNANNTAEVTIELNCLQVFNEFTPNFDGYNDYFRIECIEQYPNSVLKIFNRYGNKVYETVGYQNDWTGIANVDGAVRRGKELPAGVYYYSLVVREIGVDKSGWLYIAK